MIEQSPYDAPKSTLMESDSEIYGFKKNVIHRESENNENLVWPSRCYRCNSTASVTKDVKLYYFNPWIYLTILISPLITVIVVLIVRKKFILNLSVCEKHIKTRKRFLYSLWSMFILGVGLFAATSFFEAQTPVLVMLGSLLVFVSIIMALFSKIAHIQKRKDNYLWIRGAGKEFVNSFPDFR